MFTLYKCAKKETNQYTNGNGAVEEMKVTYSCFHTQTVVLNLSSSIISQWI